MTLGPAQIRRYARHVLLPDIGGIGQARLLAARVRVPLGADPAAEAVAVVYLAAAGVGALRLDGARAHALDADAIGRGIAYAASDRGRAPAEALADRVRALNPDCAIASDDLPATPLAIPAIELAPLAGSAVADALIRGGVAAGALLHQLATTA